MRVAGRVLGVVLVVLAGAGGCSNELHGALEATLRAGGGKQWSTTPSECVSGERQGFFGVDMRAGGSDDTLVRAILDPKDGPILKLNVPGTDQGVTVLVDRKATLFLIGTTMDYEVRALSSGFTFTNPNEKGRCGCGESFHV